MYETLDFNEPFGDYIGGAAPTYTISAAHIAAKETQLAAFTCPSDAGPAFVTDANHYGCGQGGRSYKSSYQFSVDATHYQGSWASDGLTARTAFGGNSNSKIRDFTDGMTNSVMMCETIFSCQSGQISPWFCVQHAGTGVYMQSGINIWDPAQGPGILDVYSRNASSAHVGGCHALLGDGAVRFLNENMNLTTLQRLARISDNELLGDF